MTVRGVRGATTAGANTREAILEATSELLDVLVEANGIRPSDVVSVIFTTTPDLDAEYPACAARKPEWEQTALLGAQEMDREGGVPRCIRVLIQWNTPTPAERIRHAYLRDATVLRPDRESLAPEERE